MSEPRVSVVVPLFGDHQAARALPAVCRAWLSQDVPCEIVIAVGPGTPAPDLGGDPRIRFVSAVDGPSAPGPLRNVAAAAASAPTLYLGDADIVPLGTGFLAQAMDLAAEQVVI